MRCPKCQAEEVQISSRSVPVDRRGANLRHHHATRRNCNEMLWWNAPPGAGEPTPNVGSHECGFFGAEAV